MRATAILLAVMQRRTCRGGAALLGNHQPISGTTGAGKPPGRGVNSNGVRDAKPKVKTNTCQNPG